MRVIIDTTDDINHDDIYAALENAGFYVRSIEIQCVEVNYDGEDD